MKQKINGPLPGGAAYAIIHWQDADGMPCDRTKAVQAIAFEHNTEGQIIGVSFLDLDGIEIEALDNA